MASTAMSLPEMTISNEDQIWRETFYHICSLYEAGPSKHAELLRLAGELYMEASLPLQLRLACCLALAYGVGDYVRFAREPIQHAQTILARDQSNQMAQTCLKETEASLITAEEDFNAEDKVAAQKVRRADESDAKVKAADEAVKAAEAAEATRTVPEASLPKASAPPETPPMQTLQVREKLPESAAAKMSADEKSESEKLRAYRLQRD